MEYCRTSPAVVALNTCMPYGWVWDVRVVVCKDKVTKTFDSDGSCSRHFGFIESWPSFSLALDISLFKLDRFSVGEGAVSRRDGSCHAHEFCPPFLQRDEEKSSEPLVQKQDRRPK